MIRVQHTSLHLIRHQKEDVGFGCHAGSVNDWKSTYAMVDNDTLNAAESFIVLIWL
jgi:hypothetical protein